MFGCSCSLQVLVGLAMAALLVVLGLLGVATPVGDVPLEPCMVFTDRADVPVHVGPGPERAVRLFLPAEEVFPVIGQALADEGSSWWQLMMPDIEQAWVAQTDVLAVGLCDVVPFVGAPPIIAAPGPAETEEVTPPDEPGTAGDGVWGECGSCPYCGPYDPDECVLAPDGQCLWDPGTCGYHGAPPDSGNVNPPVIIPVTVTASPMP